MLILLPPSEGKRPGGDGPKLSITTLSWHRQLGPTRQRMVKALTAVCRGNKAAAREILGLSEALDDDRAAGAVIRSSPTMPAGLRYSGVLYDALGYSSLPAQAQARADDSLITFSGLWGAVRPTDLIPAYRIGINTRLPGEPGLPVVWHRPLGAALDGLVASQGAIDLRSSGYSMMYRPSAKAKPNLRVLNVRGASFQSKLAKGAIVRELLKAGAPDLVNLPDVLERLGLSMTGTTVVVPSLWSSPLAS